MNISGLEQLMLAVLVLLVIWWMRPGLKAAMERSKRAQKDWQGLLVPLAFVVMFVFFLIAMV